MSDDEDHAAPIVRPAEPRDLDAIRTIRNDAIERSTALWTDETLTVDAARNWLTPQLAAGTVFVAELAGQVVGYGAYGPWRAKSGYRHTVENSVYVSDPAHGRGVGRALLRRLIDEASAAGKHVMIADIESGNTASIRLHEKFGFETVGSIREVGTKFDRWLDLTIMRRVLD